MKRAQDRATGYYRPNRRASRPCRPHRPDPFTPSRSVALAKPNYEYQKRQKELEKKRKKEEKLKRKQERQAVPGEGDAPAAPAPDGGDAA
jgi:hypothetical protein